MAAGLGDGVFSTAVKFEKEDTDSEVGQSAASFGDLASFSEGDVRSRSANLYADPKMRELKNFTKSHKHEERLRISADLEARTAYADPGSPPRAQTPLSPGTRAGQSTQNGPDTYKLLRSEGCSTVDQHMRQLGKETASLPKIGPSCIDVPPELSALQESMQRPLRLDKRDSFRELERRQMQLRQMDRFHTRLQWRNRMDYSLRRLLVDLELARDDRLKEYANQARCDHLDKVHEWYLKHGKKEAHKEKPVEPYIVFEPDGQVYPGSLRPTPFKLRNQSTRGSAVRVPPLRHSSSTPALSVGAFPETPADAGVQT